jgi:hypothetical protein
MRMTFLKGAHIVRTCGKGALIAASMEILVVDVTKLHSSTLLKTAFTSKACITQLWGTNPTKVIAPIQPYAMFSTQTTFFKD